MNRFIRGAIYSIVFWIVFVYLAFFNDFGDAVINGEWGSILRFIPVLLFSVKSGVAYVAGWGSLILFIVSGILLSLLSKDDKRAR